MSSINTTNLTLSYDGKSIIIDKLNIEIPHGKMTALVGPNGCGKSTLLRGISRLLKPTSGASYLNGTDIHRMKTKALARQLGILPQSPNAPEGLTVHELVAQGRYPHQSWFQQWSVEDEEITQSALEMTSLVEFADRPVDTLSGGQRQRAWIAMTLAQQTEVLLLDEPTTFLDMAYQVEVLDLLADLNAQGRTLIMVLHDLNQAARYVDYMIALRNGKLMAHGTPEELMTVANIQAVFGLACEVLLDPVSETPMCVPISKRHPKKSVHMVESSAVPTT